jgi:glycosyltransferase involved in cell wall biosynthesis
MDIFSLLSTAHEGVSQSTLQAAYLKKPLITTTVGGLPEICLNDQTGFQIVGNTNSQDVSKYVMKLNKDTSLKQRMGQQAQDLVLSKFTFDKMLDQMEVVYKTVL